MTGRGFVVGAKDQGTPASVWRNWRPDLAELSVEGWTRLVVVAAHPDDDVLGVGGLLGRLAGSSVEVTGIQLTDGTAAYPGSPTVTPTELGRLRVLEARAAYAVLGLRPPGRLQLPDGALAAHEDELTSRLRQVVRPGDCVLAPWRFDGHPDHEAAGRAARRACAGVASVRLFEYPVWMWHWASPTSPEVPWDSAYLIGLSGAERRRKRRAVRCYRTQIAPLSGHPADAPVLPPFALERLVTAREVVFGDR